MKGRLIKTDVNYILEDDKGVVIASTSLKRVEGLSLSIKNCQAIELGYDLDELAYGCDLYEKMNFVGQMNAFKLGFQKALEILGDKKYTEKDIDKAYWAGMQFVGEDKGSFGEFIQSLQQTEWDVDVVMVPAMSNNGNVYYGDIPKLDSDGCLILKRI